MNAEKKLENGNGSDASTCSPLPADHPLTLYPLNKEGLDRIKQDVRDGKAAPYLQTYALCRHLLDLADRPTKKEWMVAKDLLAEVMDAHHDPDDPTYNECDKAGEECYFCEQSRSLGVMTTREKQIQANVKALVSDAEGEL